MKKILYLITQGEFGGAQRYVFDLAKSVKDRFEVGVAFGMDGDNTRFTEALKSEGIATYTLKNMKREISPLHDLSAVFEIKRLIDRINPDIVHLNSSKMSIIGSLAVWLAKANPKVVYTAHGWVFNEPLSDGKKMFYKYAEKFTARMKNDIICVSRYDLNTALKEKIADLRKMTAIHNGLDDPGFLSREEAKKRLYEIAVEKNRLAIKEEIPGIITIGTIANFYKTKGLEHLLSAADKLKKDGILFRLVIIGDGEEREKLEKMIIELGLEDCVVLTGSLDKAFQLLKAIDIYVCSSVKEGLPYSVIEAMSAGLAIVSTDVGGIPELITNGLSGFLAPSKNAGVLAEKIKILLHNHSLRSTFGKKAKQKADAKFTLKQMTEKTLEIYDK